MGLYTFLYENLLYRLYIIHIQPARIVTARLSRYTAHTAYTAIQPYTPYIIQRYTASLSCFCFSDRGFFEILTSSTISSLGFCDASVGFCGSSVDSIWGLM